MNILFGIIQFVLEAGMILFAVSTQYFGVAYVLLLLWLGINFIFKLPKADYVSEYSIRGKSLIGVNIVNSLRIFNIFCFLPRIGVDKISVVIIVHVLLWIVSLIVFCKLNENMKEDTLCWKNYVSELQHVTAKNKIFDIKIVPYIILMLASEQVMIKIFAEQILIVKIIAVILAVIASMFFISDTKIAKTKFNRNLQEMSLLCVLIASVLLLFGFSNISILFMYIQFVKWRRFLSGYQQRIDVI